MRIGRNLTAIAIGVVLMGCGVSNSPTAASSSPQPMPTPSPKHFTVHAAIDAWTGAGLKVTDVAACPAPDPSSPIPRTWAEDVCFTIPSIAPHGGQLMSFDTAPNERAIVAYFGQFPAFAPYVYPHANVVAQLNSTLPAMEAAKFDAALAAAFGPAPAGVTS